MVWAVDRLGRSLQHLVEFLSELHSKRIDLLIHQQGIDTTTPGGKALFGMLGVFAEFERSMIQERVRAGIKRVRANDPNKLWGRKPYEVSDPALVAKVRELRSYVSAMRPIASQSGISLKTCWRLLQAVASYKDSAAYHNTPAAPVSVSAEWKVDDTDSSRPTGLTVGALGLNRGTSCCGAGGL